MRDDSIQSFFASLMIAKNIQRKIKRKDVDIKIIHKNNCGKGSALIKGFRYASRDIVLIQDADMEYDPRDHPLLLSPILSGKSKVVYGTRFSSRKRRNLKKGLLNHFATFGNRVLTKLCNILYFQKLTDVETYYKVFTADVIRNISLHSLGFEIGVELITKILKKGYAIKEVPILYHPRNYVQGKKITIIDGIRTAYYLIKYRFIE
jgi:glycosyltransferase involved in cell wall biosynthesis